MKLNRKVPVLIIPVIFTSFLLTTLVLYVAERQAIVDLTRSSVKLEAAELSGTFQQYGLIARGSLASILHSDAMRRFLDTKDAHFKSLALGGALDDILRNLSGISTDHFSITFVNSDGTLEYYYENSLDPFAEPSLIIQQWSEALIDSEVHTSTYYFTAIQRLAFCRVINRDTLNPATNFSAPSTIAIVVTISPTEYLKAVMEKEQSGRSVTYFNHEQELPETTRLETRQELEGFGVLSVKADEARVAADLINSVFRLAIWFIILAILTHQALQWLLHRYVTGPIESLERQLNDVDLDATGEITVHNTRDEIGSLSASFAMLYGKLKETYEGTRELAEKDTLTKLYNRRVFNLILNKLIARAERAEGKVALLYIDIDNFKFVNDTYGHTIGDALLRSFALRLHELVRGSDIVFSESEENLTSARLAGDEFAIIIHGYSDDDVPRKVAQRILMICQNGFSCDEGHFPVTLSVGVATWPDDGRNAEELIINADSAMYESKKSGKNTISYYSEELSEFARRQQALELALKQLDTRELRLYYMPIVDAATGQVVSLEALLRWFSKSLGFVSPAEFIPLAESIGVYRQIDMWVLERAFSDSKMLRSHFGDQVRISINISAAELASNDFVDQLFALIDNQEVAPEMFTIEITETFYQVHTDKGHSRLTDISGAGFNLAIDDFGSGYTSMLQLIEFPVNIVKIDRTFIDRIMAGNKLEVLKSLIDFCHSQDLQVTAEGVEHEADVEKLRQAGCDHLQGFHFCKPLPPAELLDYYRQLPHSR